MRGWKVEGDTRGHMQHFRSKEEVTPICIPDNVDVIVAHNAKFELLYEMRFSADAMRAFFQRGGRIFCTQYAYYLINAQAQRAQMASLDGIVEQYGGRKKIDGVKALWEAGMLTSEIDPELLEDYLIGTEEEGRNSGDMLYTGAARADAVQLGRRNLYKTRSGHHRLKYRRQKMLRRDGVLVDIPVHPELMKRIDALPETQATFLETAAGKRRSAAGLGNMMRKWCDAAKLPQCTSHGLRKACARRLAEHGATPHEIMAVTGHKTLAEVERYTEKVRRAGLADRAMQYLMPAVEPDDGAS